MEFYCISISHQTTSLDIREKLSCTQPEVGAALSYYTAHHEQFLGPTSEIAILTTCNRFEVYLTFRGENHPFVGNAEDIRLILLAFIAQVTRYDGPDLAAICRFYHDLEAVEHLFRVAAGLESQVVGEAQIIGQVAEALESALRAGSARHTLASLFRSALHAAKRAHSETAIGRNPASISSFAASIAEQALGKINDLRVVVLGAGEMSSLTVRAFHARRAVNVTIVNRSYERAARLAEQYGCKICPWDDLEFVLQSADVVVTATSAQQPILTAAALRQMVDHRQQQPLLLIDIALPRNVDPAARDLPGITIFDLDDIKLRLSYSIQQREKEAEQVEVILKEELRAFAHWMEVIPTVGKLHRKAEKIRQQEVERLLQQLPDLDPNIQEQVVLLTRSLVKKLFHEPSTRMRNEIENRDLSVYRSSLHFLFGLDDDDLHSHEQHEGRNHD